MLVDNDGNPDPWTTRKAIEHQEVSPYRIVISFVTDPTFDPKLVQLPPYQELLADLGSTDMASHVLRRIGQVMSMERLKEKYGVKKPLGFFDSVSIARLYTDILNASKKHPDYFPRLSQSEPAVSISTYEARAERERRIDHLHNSPETEVNNSRLFLFGTDENTIDATFFGDPMTSNINIIQASGRSMRFVPDKVATIAIPAMLPYYGNDLEAYAQQITPNYVHDAYRYLINILDSLASMDPVLKDQMAQGFAGSAGTPSIIEFDFPAEMLPIIRQTITTAVWKEINPENDFIENLYRDLEALNRYRLERFPIQASKEAEAEAEKSRAAIRIIPTRRIDSHKAASSHMGRLRYAIKAYFETRQDGTYTFFFLTATRVKLAMEILGWDEDFILQTYFEQSLRRDVLALEKYRLKKFPRKRDPQEEAQVAIQRERIKIVPHKQQGFTSTSVRMNKLRQSMRAYFVAGETDGVHAKQNMSADRIQLIFQIYGWNKDFVLRDEFEEALNEDMAALKKYRLAMVPSRRNPAKEVLAATLRANIKIIPERYDGYETFARRMNHLRRALKGYFEGGETEGKYQHYIIGSQRAGQVLTVYEWDRDFVLQDNFTELLKKDAAVLVKYRSEKFPYEADSSKEALASLKRAEIKYIPYGQGYDSSASRMAFLKTALESYYIASARPGTYNGRYIDADRVQLIFEIYDWSREFILQDVFEDGLRQDRAVLEKYRRHFFPYNDDPEKESIAAQNRAKIMRLPDAEGTSGRRMLRLYHCLKAYLQNEKKEGRYESFLITAKRAEQILDIYGWDEAFLLGESPRRLRRASKRKDVRSYHNLSQALEPLRPLRVHYHYNMNPRPLF